MKSTHAEQMTQLEGQRIVFADLMYGDPALLVQPGTNATLIWIRSYRLPSNLAPDAIRTLNRGQQPEGPLKHEYEAYAHNDLGHFVRLQVNSDQITNVRFPASE